MIIVLEEPTSTVELQEQVVTVYEVADFGLPQGMNESLFTQAGQLIVSIGDSLSATLDAPAVAGKYLTSNPALPNKMEWVGAEEGVTDWNAGVGTWSYSSVDSPTGVISVNADMTSRIQKGMRLKYNQDQALTAYFPMDANSTSTVGTFTSADQNTPTYTAGKFSNALTLVAASSQAVNITDTALMQLAGEFTIGAWIKTSTASTDKCIFSSYAGATSKYAGTDVSVTTGNKISFNIYANTGTTINSHWSQLIGATTVTDGSWHYVVATLRNNYMQIYVDGVLDAQGYTPFTPAYQATNYVRIGALSSTGTNGNFMNGQIDDLYIIKGYALDEETILAKYRAGTAQGTSAITVTKKAIVTNVGAYSGSATLITAYHGTDHMLTSGTISSPYYSSVKVPFGFNANPDKWSVRLTDSLNRDETTVVQNTYYNTGSLSISMPIGLWNVKYRVNLQALEASIYSINFGMSTSLSAITHGELLSQFTSAAQYNMSPVFTSALVSTTSKITFYALQMNSSGTQDMRMANSSILMYVVLTSAYL